MAKFLLLLCILFGSAACSQDISSSNLKVGMRFWSPHKNYFVEFQSDGNLVVYTASEKPVWDTKTTGTGANACIMQGDGNLVLYNGRTAVWNSETSGHSSQKSVLQMQDDGNLVINACISCFWTPLWSSQSGKWTTQEINDFPKSHPNGAKCCGRGGGSAQSPNSGITYISWKNDRCGCSSIGGGFKHYLYNTSRNRWRVTVQTTTYASPTYTSTQDYDINPGQEIYVGCSESGSEGCFHLDFTIIKREKL
jgi:hypothetical protein